MVVTLRVSRGDPRDYSRPQWVSRRKRGVVQAENSFLSPFRTAVPFGGQTTQFSSKFVPKTGLCGSKGVDLLSLLTLFKPLSTPISNRFDVLVQAGFALS